MLRRLRRPAAALGAVPLLLVLAACGSGSDEASDDPSSSSSSSATADSEGSAGSGALEEVSFEGDVGSSLKATWSAKIDKPDSTTVTTVVKGDGDEVAKGDTVSAYLYVGNGSTQKDLFSDYDNGAPESVPYEDGVGVVFEKLLEGATYGSRVVAVTNAADLFGASASSNQLGVGEDDALVVVADLVEKAAVSPTPTSDQAEDAKPDTQPTVVEKDGKPTGLDFSGLEEPALDAPVQRVVLKEGTGAAVKASDTITVNYLGSTFQADAPFDESYSAQPLTSELSGLIQGWAIGLDGVKIGSRVLLQIPPAYGYGAQGSGASIPGNATLWFVIDVVSVA